MRKLLFFLAAMIVSIAVNAEVINVSPGNNTIRTALSSAPAGATIVLSAGDYKDDNYIEFSKDVELKAADDAETIPVIQIGTYIKVQNGAKVKISGIKLDGSQQSSRDQIFRTYEGANSLLIENCEITAGKKPIFRVESGKNLDSLILRNCKIYDNTGKIISNEGTIGRIEIQGCEISSNGDIVLKGASTSHVDSCLVNNCYFHNNSQQSIYFEASGTEGRETCDKLVVKNSTFVNTTTLTNWISIIDARPYSTASSTTSDAIKVIVDHCTFYNNPCVDSGHANIRTHYLSDVSVSNCIFMHPTELAQRATYCDGGGTVSNCLTYNFTKDPERYGISYGCTMVACAAGDPLFTDAANGDFTLAEESPAIDAGTDGKTLGDPRWWPVIVLPETDFSTPYVCAPAKAKLSGKVSLKEDSLLWNNNSDATQNGVATWKIHATKGCYITATINNASNNGSGHCWQVAILDAEGDPTGDPVAEAETTWSHKDDLLTGTLLIPEEGDYTIKLSNSTAWSKAALMSITLTYVAEPKSFFLKPGVWAADGAKFAVWDITHSAWSEFMTLAENETDIYTTTIPADAAKVIFVRLNGSLDEPAWNPGEEKVNVWNQTADLDIVEGKDMYTITGWETGSWSKYEYVVPAKFYITGDAALVGEEKAWNADAIKATEESYTFENLAAGAYKMKVTVDGTWDTAKGIANLTEKATGLQDINGNIGFILAEESNVTVTYTAETFTVQGNFVNTPIVKTYFATGEGWTGDDASSAVYDAENEKIVVNLVQSKQAQWQAQVWYNTGVIAEASKYYNVSLKIKASKAIGGVIAKYQDAQNIFSKEGIALEADVAYELEMINQAGKDGGDGMLIFDFGYAPAETTVEIYDISITSKAAPNIEDGFYLIGRINGEDAWDIFGVVADNKFVTNPGTPEFMLETTLAIGDELQVVNVLNKAITAWFPGGEGNNFEIDAWHAGEKTIYFRPDKEGGDGWHHGCMYIAPNEPVVTYSDFEIDLRAGQLGTDGSNPNNKYLVVGDPYQYLADMPLAYNAYITSAKYNGSQHGYVNLVATIPVVAGNYKITVGNCEYNNGKNGAVKNADGSETLNLIDKNGQTITAIETPKNCYHNNTAENITSVWFVAEAAQTIQIVCPQYAPYIKVENVGSVPAPVTVYTATFVNAEGATGIVPAAMTDLALDAVITLPNNYTMYKEGFTFTGWTDGDASYAPGSPYIVKGNINLFAEYESNSVSLNSRPAAVTIKWLFSQNDGVAPINVSGGTTFVVAQAIIDEEVIDVQLPIDATVGKIVNSSNTWTQINPGVIFSIPSAKDAVITYKLYDNGAVTTPEINVTETDAIYNLTAEGTSGKLYIEYIQVVLPKTTATAIDNTAVEGKAVKRIENGQLLIERDGKTFNVLGAELK